MLTGAAALALTRAFLRFRESLILLVTVCIFVRNEGLARSIVALGDIIEQVRLPKATYLSNDSGLLHLSHLIASLPLVR